MTHDQKRGVPHLNIVNQIPGRSMPIRKYAPSKWTMPGNISAFSKPLTAILLLWPLSACSTSLNSIFERSVSSEHITYDKVLTMTGERRVALVVPYVDKTLSKADEKEFYEKLGHVRKVICAESLPDAARSIDAKTDLTANLAVPVATTGIAPSGEQKVSDTLKTSVLQTFVRTETADVVRQLGWQICQGYANGAIREDEYRDLLKSVIAGSFQTLAIAAANKATLTAVSKTAGAASP